MDISDDTKQDKSHLSEWIEYDKNFLSNNKNNKDKKEIFLNSCNDYSELRQSYNNTILKNISIDFGFPNTRNTYKYKRSFPLNDCPMFEQRNTFYYDKNFQLFKNKSVSKYGEPKNKNNSLSKFNSMNKITSPQHKIITSIKKKKNVDDIDVQDYYKNKNNKSKNQNEKEKDIYELEVINQVIFNETDEEKTKRNDGKISPRDEKVSEGDWGEIEQIIFENEKDKKNNLLNSIHVEIEKENGDKQLKIVEISKEERERKDPCIKIKYIVEDKFCLQSDSPREEIASNLEKEIIKDSSSKGSFAKTNTGSKNNFSFNSFKKHDSTALRKERASEILLKEVKSSDNFFSSVETEKKSEKRISIKPISHKFDKEELLSSTSKRRSNTEQTEEKEVEIFPKKSKKLMDIINDEQEKTNKSIEIEEQFFIKDKNSSITKEEEKNDKNLVNSRKLKVLDYDIDENINNEGKNTKIEENINQKEKYNRFGIKRKIIDTENEDKGKNLDENKDKNIKEETNVLKKIEIQVKKDKKSPKKEKEEIIEKEVQITQNEKKPYRSRFTVKDKNNEEEPQINKNEIKEKRIIERYKSDEEENEEKTKKDRYTVQEKQEVIEDTKENKQSGGGIRDRYMKKKKIDENDENDNEKKLKIINIETKKNRFGNDISTNLMTEKDTSDYIKSKLDRSRDKDINIKRQIKTEVEKEEIEEVKPIYKRNRFLKQNEEEIAQKEMAPKKEVIQEDNEEVKPIFKRNRFFKQNEEEIEQKETLPKKEVIQEEKIEKNYKVKSRTFPEENKDEVKKTQENANLTSESENNTKKYRTRRFFVNNDNNEEKGNIKEPENENKVELNNTNKHRFRTFQNKIKEKELNEKNEREERIEIEKQEKEKEKERERIEN